MKKNKAMRLAMILLVVALLSTSVISGTLAKYTTSVSGNDSARVAVWGFDAADSAVTLGDLFSKNYAHAKVTTGGAVIGAEDVIAPGTYGSGSFKFVYDGGESITAPEVAYNFKVDTTGSSCADDIKNNANIRFALDLASSQEGTFNQYALTWDQLIAEIEKLSGASTGNNKDYAPGNLPTGFNSTKNEHTVHWMWNFSTDAAGDTADTALGNKPTLDEVKLAIAITATQLDTYTAT